MASDQEVRPIQFATAGDSALKMVRLVIEIGEWQPIHISDFTRVSYQIRNVLKVAHEGGHWHG